MIVPFQDLVAIQREIYLAFADRIGDFAKTGDWTLLAAYLPMTGAPDRCLHSYRRETFRRSVMTGTAASARFWQPAPHRRRERKAS
jgi:hypothetical protein